MLKYTSVGECEHMPYSTQLTVTVRMERLAQVQHNVHVTPAYGRGLAVGRVSSPHLLCLVLSSRGKFPTAVCSPSCAAPGGSCTQPGQCTCAPRWTGSSCRVGKETDTEWPRATSEMFLQQCVTLTARMEGPAPALINARALRSGWETLVHCVNTNTMHYE